MKKFYKLLGVIAIGAVIAIGMAGCDTGTGSDDTGNNTGGNNTGNNTGGNTGGNNTGGNNTGNNTGDNTGGNTGGDNTGGDTTFTPPTKAQVSEYLESHRTNPANKIGSSNAAVYIKSITVNTYTINGTSIATNPAAVPENANVKVTFTIRTILSYNNLTMGERLNIDNYRVALIDALRNWLKQQGFKDVPSTNITTGSTVFG
jgi:hypothetical protein